MMEGVIVALECETEITARSDEMKRFLAVLANMVLEDHSIDQESLTASGVKPTETKDG